MTYCLDRFEGEKAVIECDNCGKITYMKVGRDKVSPKAREGEALKLVKGIFTADAALTEKRRAALKAGSLKRDGTE